MSEIIFEIKNHIGDVSPENSSGWKTELNLVSWNGSAPKYDIRSWSPDHQKMSKGITLTADELSKLGEIIQGVDFGE